MHRTFRFVHTDLDSALGDHRTVNLVDDAINLLRFKTIRDDLVARDDIL